MTINFQQSAESIVRDGDFFWQDQLLELAHDIPSLVYSKRDFLYQSGIWRDRPVEALSKGRKGTIRTLALGHSDYSVSCIDLAHIFRSVKPRRVFASNLSCGFKLAKLLNAHPLPLGLTNPTNESPAHSILGNTKHFALAYDLNPEVVAQGNEKLYVNFTSRNAPRTREKALNVIKDAPFAVTRTPKISNQGRVRFLADIRTSGLVVCPEGNGLDTHRFYESLLMGGLPVVLKSSYSYRLSRHLDLPCIAISTWKDLLNIDHLRESAASVRRQPYSLDALRGSFWREVILG